MALLKDRTFIKDIFAEKTIIYTSNNFETFVKTQLSIHEWVYFWTLFYSTDQYVCFEPII